MKENELNSKINYNQNKTECIDKLMRLCERWEMDDSEKSTMTLEVDDDFMSTIYSVLKLLRQQDKKAPIEYREFMDLTDEEIVFAMKDIFSTDRVDNIERDEKWQQIHCDIYIMEEEPDFPDTMCLDLQEITTSDFLTDEESQKWQQYLLAKGCDWRLKDNPYFQEHYIIDK